MERKLYRRHNRLPHQASREHLREVEKTLLKKHHTTWGWPIFTFWFLSMIAWTILFIYVNNGGLRFYQSNCEGKLDYTLSPNKPENRLGGSDYIIEHWLPRKTRSAGEHRRLERRITVGVTGFLFLLWLVLNLWLYIEGLNKFLLSGADFLTFGQVEQLTALFPDFLALYLGVHGYLKSRDELRETRERLTATEASRRSSARASQEESEPRLSGETYRGAFDLPRPPTIGSFKELKRDSFWHDDNLHRIITSSSGASDPHERGRHASVRASGAEPNPESAGNEMHNLRHRSRSSGRPATFGRTSFATLTPQP
ncbi:hypothetical protein C6P46_000406 [Rhodotorula mucilaginosa]|uniref:Uncharacterized protein n=1 Tax=Rhodotorula mucilaginosa TaxID=5537 RepID=A0A9P6VWM7_RHOMI|nr:hypothetical protein C6P46_000714 [Rhodotorula mucilaginosa]KAG0656167.1 hypothetical protein C6P46_000406 [Rhodotorula mucilaginosa]TKA52788.1 hypothetical protein B0A53_04484 [Rhodotorula sp. CCFEE 5036]